MIPRRLTGLKGVAAAAGPALLLLVVLVAPLGQLLVWAAGSLDQRGLIGDLAHDTLTSLLLAGVTTVLAALAATSIAYGARAANGGSRAERLATRASAIGYAVPGTVVAVCVYTVLAWTEHRIGDLGDVLGLDLGLVLTGTVAGLVFAYVMRFHALALFAVEARMKRIDPALDDAARSLGADRSRVLADVHLPLLWPGILSAALLVFVEVMKELPATALLRPLGGDTLAIAVWEATKDSRFDTAALPALFIVAAGVVPVILLVRLSRGGEADR